MKHTDTISVLLCVHSRDQQHDQMLDRALNSLAAQTHDDFETIVVLDECWDFTKQVVQNYSAVLNLKIFERSHKQGLAAAKNFGLQKIDSDWVAYLDGDDTWMDCKLEVQRDYMLKRPEVDFCGTESWDRDGETGVITPNCFEVGQYQTHLEISRRLPEENVMCHGSMMIRLDSLLDLGGYSTESRCLGWEDYDLWLRAVERNLVFAKVPERLYVWTAGTSVAR
jgi:glycosyltransferase involved in cell wall biosynthesis